MQNKVNNKGTKGVALIIVMGLVSAIGAASIVIFAYINQYILSASYSRLSDQSYEYLYAAEYVGVTNARNILRNYREYLVIENLNSQQIQFPIKGGLVKGNIVETPSCFNLNSLVDLNSDNLFVANNNNMRIFENLLVELKIGKTESKRLTAALTDWQDTDQQKLMYGAEYSDYNFKDYTNSNFIIFSILELRNILGFSESLIDALENYVCLDRDSLHSKINLSNINLDDKILIKSFLAPYLNDEEILQIINSRPYDGYTHSRDFWKHPVFFSKKIPDEIKSNFINYPSRFKINVEIIFNGITKSLESNVVFKPDGSHTILSRKLGG